MWGFAGFRVQGVGFRFRVQGSGFRAQGLGRLGFPPALICLASSEPSAAKGDKGAIRGEREQGLQPL